MNRKQLYNWFIIVLLVCSSLPLMVQQESVKATGSTYYVAKTGNDVTGTGSYALPWLTIQKGINSISGGDTLYVMDGDYNENLSLYGNLNGSSIQWTTIASLNHWGATINGNGMSIDSFTEALFYLRNVSYVRVTGFQIKNSSYKGVNIHGIHTNHVMVDNNSFYNLTDGACCAMRKFDDPTMTLLIQNVTIENNTCVNICNGYSHVSSGEGISTAGGKNCVIQYNSINQCSMECINTLQSYYCTVRYNLINDTHINNLGANEVGILCDACQYGNDHIQIYNNRIWGNGIGIILEGELGGSISNISVFNNIIDINETNGLTDSSGISLSYNVSHTDIDISSNTIYVRVGNNNNAILSQLAKEYLLRINISNNIFYAPNSIVAVSFGNDGPVYGINSTDANIICTNNLYYSNAWGATWISWRDGWQSALPPSDTNGIIDVLPQFVSESTGDFHLNTTSPCVDAGTSLFAPVFDYDGESRPQLGGYDIGAYELPFPKTTNTSWFNYNWQYKKLVNITNPSANYPISLWINYSSGGDVDLESHCNVNLSDVRFINANQTDELPYWIENTNISNGSLGPFWIKSNGESSMWIYYGNASANYNMSDPNNIFYFYDDFSNATIDYAKWNVTNPLWILYPNATNPVIKNGNLQLKPKPGGSGEGGIHLDQNLTNYPAFSTIGAFVKSRCNFTSSLVQWAYICGLRKPKDTSNSTHHATADSLLHMRARNMSLSTSATVIRPDYTVWETRSVLWTLSHADYYTNYTNFSTIDNSSYIPNQPTGVFLKEPMSNFGGLGSVFVDYVFAFPYVSPEPSFSLFGLEYGQLPNVTTNTATGIGLNNATLQGTLTDTGTSTNCNVGFQYGTTTDYGNNIDVTPGFSYNIYTDNPYNYVYFPEEIYLLNTSLSSNNTIGKLLNIINNGDIPTNANGIYRWNGADWNAIYYIDEAHGWSGDLSPTEKINYIYLYCFPGNIPLKNFTIMINYDSPTLFYYNITDLSPASLYHYRAVAVNDYGYGYGNDSTFTTLGYLNVTNNGMDATNVNETQATLHGYLAEVNLEPNTVRFEYGTTSLYGTNTTNQTVTRGTSFSDTITGLTPGQLYYWRVFANDTNTSVYSSVNWFLTKPYNLTCPVATVLPGPIVNFSWIKGTGANTTILVMNHERYPLSITDGTIIYNDTGTYFEYPVTQGVTYNVRAWSYDTWTVNPTFWHYSDNYTDFNFSIIGFNVFNESNPSQNITFDLELSSLDGSFSFVAYDCENTFYVNISDIQSGTTLYIIIRSDGYKLRQSQSIVYDNTIYNNSYYLPPDVTESGTPTPDEDCALRTAIDSISISNPAVDATITLQHDLEEIISVEIYNKSLYGTYGGWLFIASSNYTTTTNTVIINESVLDANTTMARVQYYYMYCPGQTIETPLYYLRVVETIETEYTEVDRGVPDALVSIKRYISTTDSYEEVSLLPTDANGYVNVYLIPDTLYLINITKTGYEDMISRYITSPPNQFGQTAEKIFRIVAIDTQGGTVYHETLFTNLTYSLEPTSTRHTTGFTVYYNITSTDSLLEWYRLIIYYKQNGSNTWILLNDQNETNSTGGSLSYTIANQTGQYAIECWFKKIGYPAYEIYNSGSMVYFIVSIKTTASLIPDEAYFIITIVLMLVGMGACILYFTSGPITGYVGLGIMAFMFFLHDVSINTGAVLGGAPVMISGWVIFGITFLLYTSALLLWSRL